VTDKSLVHVVGCNNISLYRGADKSLAPPTSPYILFDGDNIPFDAGLVIYIYISSTNDPPIMIINRTRLLLLLLLQSALQP
jgi:hypothetical protein